MIKKNIFLKLEDIHLAFGGIIALDGVSLKVFKGEMLAIIGPNGAGKTCILNCINGFYRPQRGKIYFQEKEITRIPSHKIAKLGISRTFQNIELYSGLTVLENLLAGRHIFMNTGLFWGALYLAAVCVLPTFLMQYLNVPFYFGGIALLIVVGVGLDTMRQVESHLVMRYYDGFMKKALKGRQG